MGSYRGLFKRVSTGGKAILYRGHSGVGYIITNILSFPVNNFESFHVIPRLHY